MSLESYFKLDNIESNQVIDLSGNNQDGTIYGGVSVVSNEPTVGKCLLFDGVDGYIQLGNADTLGLTNHSFTVSAWINFSEVLEDKSILGTDTTGPNEGLSLIIRNGHPYLGFFGNDMQHPKVLETNKWYHITWVYDIDRQEQVIYVNGREKEVSTSHAPFTGTSEVKIGRWDSSNYFKGKMAALKIYSNALTEAEIVKEVPRFVANHLPPLATGNYTLEVTQELQVDNEIKTSPSQIQNFAILGERFALKPEDIQATFPPDGSFGDYEAVLPHIVLNRSTLPWERHPIAIVGDADPEVQEKKETPWLALLLFDDDEKPQIKIKTWEKVRLGTADEGEDFINPYTFEEEYGQENEDKLTVIDVPKNVLQKTLPEAAELKWLAHVRRSYRDLAVIIGNRLPKPGGSNTIHLVSLESFYNADSMVYQDATGEQNIRLISLHHWSFANESVEKTLEHQLKTLQVKTLRLPDSMLPDNQPDDVKDKFKAGKIAFNHYYPGGSTKISWYRGPLSPVVNEVVPIALPAAASDKLLRYDEEVGILDTSYAAAWELGRQLALQSKAFAIGYYNWKRALIQQLKQLKQEADSTHPHQKGLINEISIPSGVKAWLDKHDEPDALPMNNEIMAWLKLHTVPMPVPVKQWITDIHLFKSIPFHYLVPDEKMLPEESIAFFSTDFNWLQSMVDGACSISRITDDEVAYAKTIRQLYIEGNMLTHTSGVVIRSNAVSEWKDLLVEADITVDGISKTDQQPLRIERLSTTVLMVVFKGDIQSVKFHHSPDVLHFGLEGTPTDPFNFDLFSKDLRQMEHGIVGDFYPAEDPQHITNGMITGEDTARRIDITALKNTIDSKFPGITLTIDQFAAQMIETVPVVIFNKE